MWLEKLNILRRKRTTAIDIVHPIKLPDLPCPRYSPLPSSTDSPSGLGSKSSSAAHPALDFSERNFGV